MVLYWKWAQRISPTGQMDQAVPNLPTSQCSGMFVRFSFGVARRSCTGRQHSIPMDSMRESSSRKTLPNAFWKEVCLQVELHPGGYVVKRRLTSSQSYVRWCRWIGNSSGQLCPKVRQHQTCWTILSRQTITAGCQQTAVTLHQYYLISINAWSVLCRAGRQYFLIIQWHLTVLLSRTWLSARELPVLYA